MAEHPILLTQAPVLPIPQAVVVDVGAGQVVDLPATPEAALAIDGRDVLVAQPEAPPIVLRNFVEMAEANPPPIVQFADAAISAPELIDRLAITDAVRVDTLLQTLPTDVAPPARTVLLPDFLPPPLSLAEANGDPFTLRDELFPVVQPTVPQAPPVSITIAEPGSLAAPEAPAQAAPAVVLPPGGADDDAILGSPGDDVAATDGSVSFIDLGGGTDTLDLSGVGSLDLGERDYKGIEKIDLRGGEANVLTLSAADVLDLSSTTDTLLVRGEAADCIVIGDGWTPAGSQSNPQGEVGTFNAYSQSVGEVTATLLVENAVSVE